MFCSVEEQQLLAAPVLQQFIQTPSSVSGGFLMICGPCRQQKLLNYTLHNIHCIVSTKKNTFFKSDCCDCCLQTIFLFYVHDAALIVFSESMSSLRQDGTEKGLLHKASINCTIICKGIHFF